MQSSSVVAFSEVIGYYATMTIVTVHQAKAELSKLIARAEAGEEIIIARRNKPVARLMPIASAPSRKRAPGAWKGRFAFPDSVFFDPLPEEELQAWEGAYSFDPET
jgi:prevent-host-death family protein